jgi:hypothetical protein
MLADLRIQVVFGDLSEAGPHDAVLAEGNMAGAGASFVPGSGHPPGCSCCVGRSEAGRALAGLLHARARGEVSYFTRVVAVVKTEAGRAELCLALASDPVASLCFKG